jgi:hypothetical protein
MGDDGLFDDSNTGAYYTSGVKAMKASKQLHLSLKPDN